MRRRTITMLALTALALGLSPAVGTAAAASSYQDAVDITVPAEGTYSDDYANGRAGGRVHRATDIFNDPGTGVHAAVAGTVGWAPSSEHPTAGFALQIKGDDGRTYAYYHLGKAGGSRADALAEGIDSGVRVERGQLIGYLGNSGNARHTPPHLHFEIHDPGVTDPHGTDRMNPYASLNAAHERGDVPGDSGSGSAGAEASGGDEYTIRSGDTLSKIARAHGLSSWRAVADANPSIGNPNLIFPGQSIVLP